MNSLIKKIGVGFAVVTLMGFGYVFGANGGISGLTSFAAGALPFLNQSPSVTISKNVNSPSGQIISGRSQIFGVFDLKSTSFSKGDISRIHFSVDKAGSGVINVNNFFVEYKYCLPKGNIYKYGYKYGYSGTYCQNYSGKVSVVPMNGGYDLVLNNANWPVYSDATSATITVGGTPTYTNSKNNEVAQIKVGVYKDLVLNTKKCSEIRYGYRGKYGYTKCTPVQPKVNVSNAVTPWIKIVRPYGYSKNQTKSCDLTVTSLKPNAQVNFPLKVKGTVNNTEPGCSWLTFEGQAGTAQLFFNYQNKGWKPIGSSVPVKVSNSANKETTFEVVLNFNNGAIGLSSGTPMKIVFTSENAAAIKPSKTIEFPIIFAKNPVPPEPTSTSSATSSKPTSGSDTSGTTVTPPTTPTIKVTNPVAGTSKKAGDLINVKADFVQKEIPNNSKVKIYLVGNGTEVQLGAERNVYACPPYPQDCSYLKTNGILRTIPKTTATGSYTVKVVVTRPDGVKVSDESDSIAVTAAVVSMSDLKVGSAGQSVETL